MKLKKKKCNYIISKIQNNQKPLSDGDLIKEISIENKEIIRPVYNFLINNFDSFDVDKSFQCLILINILFLTNIKNRPAQADRIFLQFIIDKLLSEDKYFKYGLVSLHLFLSRFDNHVTHLLMKNLKDDQRTLVYNLIIDGLLQNESIEINPNNYFDKIDINIESRK